MSLWQTHKKEHGTILHKFKVGKEECYYCSVKDLKFTKNWLKQNDGPNRQQRMAFVAQRRKNGIR